MNPNYATGLRYNLEIAFIGRVYPCIQGTILEKRHCFNYDNITDIHIYIW